jgi:hypothetical protein
MKYTRLIVLLGIFSIASANAASIFIPATADIFASDGNRAPGGSNPNGATAPVSFNLSPGNGRVFNLDSLTGSVTWNSGVTETNPDSNPYGGNFFPAVNVLSGVGQSQWFPLYGVFLGDTLPSSAPMSLDFRASGLGIAFTQLSPALGQVFFIGDGRTGTGSGQVQDFIVPDGATRLFLGFNDDVWGDNGGGYGIEFSVIPEPSSALLFGLTGLLASLRRRRTT